MIRILVKSCYFLTLWMMFLFTLSVLIIATQPGITFLISLGQNYLPGTLSLKNVHGTLITGIELQDVRYKQEQLYLRLADIKIDWEPHALKKHQLIFQWQNLKLNQDGKPVLNLPSGRLSSTINYPEIDATLNNKLDLPEQGLWLLKGNISGALPWQWRINALLTEVVSNKNKTPGFHSDILLTGQLQTANQGTAQITLKPGYYQVPDNASIPPLTFNGGDIKFTLTPARLRGAGDLSIDPQKALKLDFLAPNFSLDTGFTSNQRFQAKANLVINSLDFLQNLSSEIRDIKGRINAAVVVTGTVDKPNIKSQIALDKARFNLPQLGFKADDLSLTLNALKQRWDLNGNIVSQGKKLTLKGSGQIKESLAGDIYLEANSFPLIKTPEYQVDVSPRLKLQLATGSLIISGSILVPNATIQIQNFTNSVSLSEDVVIKKEEKPASNEVPLQTTIDVNLLLGEQVALNVKGLKGHLGGNLNVKQQPQGALNAYGLLSVKDGTYKAYGQELSIKQGQLIFTGGPITNPGINVRAAKKINNSANYTSASQLFNFNNDNLQNMALTDNITLGVEVTGRLTQPKIQLYSDPAILSQADILSMLVLGRPASQANKAGGQLLLTAISSMNVGGTNSTQLLEQLKRTSGLDLNVQTTTNYNQFNNTVTDSTAFVVGKSLSKRLYLSYNIGLSQADPNVLSLKYILNKFFSIQISNSANSSGIDVLYTGSKKK